MTRWGAYRGGGRARAAGLRVGWCDTCQAERAFARDRCITCHRKRPSVSKMGNRPTTVDGVRYDSQAERDRHAELLWMQRDGLIRDLRYHPGAIPLEVNGVRICEYEPDFRYEDVTTGRRVIEDVKGWADPGNPAYRLFKLKARLVQALTGTPVSEVVMRQGRRRAG